jgi:hypothetical protein
VTTHRHFADAQNPARATTGPDGDLHNNGEQSPPMTQTALRVLFVDELADDRVMYGTGLQRLGFELCLAGSLADAVAKLGIWDSGVAGADLFIVSSFVELQRSTRAPRMATRGRDVRNARVSSREAIAGPRSEAKQKGNGPGVSLMSNYMVGRRQRVFRDSVGGRVAEWSLPDLLDQTWRAAAALVCEGAARLQRRHGAIRVPKVSQEWLAGHAVESEKHLDP